MVDPTTAYALTYAIIGFIVLALFFYSVIYNRIFGDRSGGDQQRQVVPPPRAEARGGVRRRPVRQVQIPDDDDDGDFGGEEMEGIDPNFGDSKKVVGTKKAKKLEEKEARRQQREAEAADRKERAEEERLRREQKEQEELEEKKHEEEKLAEEKRLREEAERQEYEAYLKLKAEFSVDEEGTLEVAPEAAQNLLFQFISYIKEEKIVMLEDLAARFQMRVQDAIDRLQTLIADGHLTGVIDERGKFVYVSVEELQNVASYIQSRGRVSFVELVNSSNLITIPEKRQQQEAQQANGDGKEN